MMYKVALDPGHGGKDNGAVKYLTEDAVNLTEALACRDFLQATGYFDIWMSRTKDTKTDLNTTCNSINKWGADIAVSFHNNAGGGDGFEAYHAARSTKGQYLAFCIEKRVKATGQNSRGLKTRSSGGADYYAFNRIPKCPSVIIEGCFVDNKKDAAGFDTTAEQQAYGYAVAKGILDYYNVKERPTFKLLEDMNMRAENNLRADVVQVVPAGTIVSGILLLNGWLKCTVNGKAGYIRVKGQNKEYGKRL